MIQRLCPTPERATVLEGTVDLSRVQLQSQLEPAQNERVLRPLFDTVLFDTVLFESGHRQDGGDGQNSPDRFLRPDPAATPLRLRYDDRRPTQGYHLRLGDGAVELRAADLPGFFYGAATLAQWRRLHPGHHVAAVEITDRPIFAHRGVLIDVSRNKVPSLETLLLLIDRLSRLKINQVQLYFEHTFAYRGHCEAWQGWSPITPDEAVLLDRHCRERFIELTPHQNSCGHLHRWLVHDRYRPLAECPEGIEHPFSRTVEPFSLCPIDPASLELLADLYDQLLPCFASPRLHVGLDETIEVGRGRSAAACRERGGGRVYLDFLRDVHSLVSERQGTMLFWADMILQTPELLAELPEGVVALDWGYEADHPFADETARLAAAGIEHWVCPGTSSWCSLVGRFGNALANLESAAQAGAASGASGYLITDWGDYGHLQPLPVSLPGLLAGAAFAWSGDAAHATNDLWADRLAAHLIGEATPGVASALLELGDLYHLPGAPSRHTSVLFRLFRDADRLLVAGSYDGLSRSGLEDVLDRLDQVRQSLAPPPSSRWDGDLLVDELGWIIDLTAWAADLGVARLERGRERPSSALAASQRRDLVARMQALIERLPGVWLARNRRGGLPASQGLMEIARDALKV